MRGFIDNGRKRNNKGQMDDFTEYFYKKHRIIIATLFIRNMKQQTSTYNSPIISYFSLLSCNLVRRQKIPSTRIFMNV